MTRKIEVYVSKGKWLEIENPSEQLISEFRKYFKIVKVKDK